MTLLAIKAMRAGLPLPVSTAFYLSTVSVTYEIGLHSLVELRLLLLPMQLPLSKSLLSLSLTVTSDTVNIIVSSISLATVVDYLLLSVGVSCIEHLT